jgi:hypothetical protein
MASSLQKSGCWVVAGLALLGVVLAVPDSGGDEPSNRAAAANQQQLARFIYGGRYCSACHDQKYHPVYKPEELDRLACRMDEYGTFHRQDKHQLAFQALTGDRGREMGKLLRADVQRLDACVNCHSVPEKGAESRLYSPDDDGVTCVACHGAHADWVEKHPRASQEWRGLDRAEKERRFGMTDLSNPVRRSEVCANCHVGNAAEGKVITHVMYAAGHPPLPNFEPATYGELEPRHWQVQAEKSARRPRPVQPAGARPDLEQTKLVLVGELVVLRETLKLLVPESGGGGPDAIGAASRDLARFDCNACHHDLRADEGSSWRQRRRRDAAPGRPMPPEWPMVLVELAIQAAEPRPAATEEQRFRRLRTALEDAMRLHPFGEPETTARAARDLINWTDSLLERSQRATIDLVKAHQFLSRLTEIAAETIPDYSSARQIAWAFRVIYHEITPKDRRDPEIEARLVKLETELGLDLPPTRTKTLIQATLPDRLGVAAAYDPTSFQTRFQEIATQLMRR